MRHITRRRRASAMIAIALAVPAGVHGCGALYGGAAGAYVAAGANTCWESSETWNGSCSSACGGNGDATLLIAAIAVGAAIGAIGEIVRWLSEGGSSW